MMAIVQIVRHANTLLLINVAVSHKHANLMRSRLKVENANLVVITLRNSQTFLQIIMSVVNVARNQNVNLSSIGTQMVETEVVST